MANQYKQFLTLLKSWPVDKTKTNRDVAVFLREEVKKAFSRGSLSTADEQKCAQVLASLNRLNNNYYGDKYRRSRNSSATGLSREECNGILSTEFLEELERTYRKGFIRSLIERK